MGVQGSPELPADTDETLRTNNIAVINHGPNTSDESDNEDGHGYEGYQPLPLNETNDDNDMEDTNVGIPNPLSDTLPPIENSDVEIQRQVWNQPRPRELTIELDSNRTQQIMAAMANITLPSSAVPEWAQAISEDRWKEDLLDRIRGKTEGHSSKETSSPK